MDDIAMKTYSMYTIGLHGDHRILITRPSHNEDNIEASCAEIVVRDNLCYMPGTIFVVYCHDDETTETYIISNTGLEKLDNFIDIKEIFEKVYNVSKERK